MEKPNIFDGFSQETFFGSAYYDVALVADLWSHTFWLDLTGSSRSNLSSFPKISKCLPVGSLFKIIFKSVSNPNVLETLTSG